MITIIEFYLLDVEGIYTDDQMVRCLALFVLLRLCVQLKKEWQYLNH